MLEVLEHNAENDEDEKFDDLLSLIDVIFGDVDHEEKRIHFYKRGVNPNTENKKNIGFAHLINILSGLRKEK